MKIVQTFWSGPASQSIDNLILKKAGWLSYEYHWMSWALSCLQAKRTFGEVNLVTDNVGKEILIDLLKLPYQSVSTALQGKLNDNHPSLWALAKMYSYSIQTEPFLHLDGDVFLWQKPPKNVLSSPLIAQNRDVNLPLYAEVLHEINDNFSFIPEVFSRDFFENKNIYASNAGLMGGYQLSFFKEYYLQAVEFIDKNKPDLEKLDTGSLNFIFEQYLFCQLAAKMDIKVSYYKPPVDDPVFKDYIRFEDYPNVQMVHPVGGFKQYAHVCDHLAKTLRQDYPEYYYRIINLMRNASVNFRSAIYSFPGLAHPALTPPLKTEGTQPVNKPLFIRTEAAVDFLNRRLQDGSKINFDAATTADFLNNILNINGLARDDKERLLEVFYLETESNALLKDTYKSAALVNELYAENVNTYDLIRQTFSLPKNDLLNTRVSIVKTYLQLELGWDWKYDYLKDIPAIIERNFNEEKLQVTVVLTPDVLQAAIKEYCPDVLDLIIIETLKTPFTIGTLLTEMKQYFSDEEIEEDYSAYELLIINVVKRLTYFDILKINI